MNKDRRNIQKEADKQVKHLMVLLDKSEASEFKKMVPELQDNWVKKQMFRTETEMRFSVLSDKTEKRISVSVLNSCFLIQVS